MPWTCIIDSAPEEKIKMKQNPALRPPGKTYPASATDKARITKKKGIRTRQQLQPKVNRNSKRSSSTSTDGKKITNHLRITKKGNERDSNPQDHGCATPSANARTGTHDTRDENTPTSPASLGTDNAPHRDGWGPP